MPTTARAPPRPLHDRRSTATRKKDPALMSTPHAPEPGPGAS